MKLFVVGLLVSCAEICNCQAVEGRECFVDVSSEAGVSISQEVLQNISTTLLDEIDLDDLATSAQLVGDVLALQLQSAQSLRDVGMIVTQLLQIVLTYQDEAVDFINFLIETLSPLTTICVDGEPLQPQQFLEELFQDLDIDSFPDPEPVVQFITEAVTRVWQQITQSDITQTFLDSFTGIISGIQTRNNSFDSIEQFNDIATGIVEGTVDAFQNFTSNFDTEEINQQIQGALNATGDFVEAVGEGFSGFLEDIGNWFQDTFEINTTQVFN